MAPCSLFLAVVNALITILLTMAYYVTVHVNILNSDNSNLTSRLQLGYITYNVMHNGRHTIFFFLKKININCNNNFYNLKNKF